jgi:hypothetical protein
MGLHAQAELDSLTSLINSMAEQTRGSEPTSQNPADTDNGGESAANHLPAAAGELQVCSGCACQWLNNHHVLWHAGNRAQGRQSACHEVHHHMSLQMTLPFCLCCFPHAGWHSTGGHPHLSVTPGSHRHLRLPSKPPQNFVQPAPPSQRCTPPAAPVWSGHHNCGRLVYC